MTKQSFQYFKSKLKLLSWLVLIEGIGFALVQPSFAQSNIVPDTTLGIESSRVINDLSRQEIIGGAQRGINLFHSFQEFNINEGNAVFFNNPAGIENILGRVTGNNPSTILGTLGVLGDANLFLLNPNGIIFGENASLDVNGSFLGSTAQSIVFGNNIEFSAVNPESPPLLTINMPIGLNLGVNAGDITVQGVGNNLSLNPETSSIVRDRRPVGLEVDSDQTLALVGGNITLEGGNITAPGGRIELGSVGEGEVVKLNSTNSGWTLSYEDVSNFQDISLSQGASVDASGSEGISSAQVQGRRVTVEEQSAILAQSLGDFSGGEMIIKASEEIVVSGFAIDMATVELDTFPSTISTDVQPNATGDAGNLLFETKSLKIIDAAQIGSGTFGIGNGATLSVKAEEVEVSGSSLVRPGGLFNASEPGAIGNAGNIEIETEQLLVADGSVISAFARNGSQGDAGNINITAEKIEIIGRDISRRSFIATVVDLGATGRGGNINIKSQQLKLNSGIITSSTNGDLDSGNLSIEAESIRLDNNSAILGTTDGEGNGGDIIVETKNLRVDSSQIGTGTFGAGNAGELKITAQDIEIIGSPLTTFTGIFSSGGLDGGSGNGNRLTIETERLRVLNGGTIAADTLGTGTGGDLEIHALEKVEIRGESIFVPSSLTVEATEKSNAGNLSLETGELIVADGGLVTVSSPQGEAGNLQINADSLVLDRGTLSAETGRNSNTIGADITLQIVNTLQLSNESQITATALETANGGNIDIDANFLVAFPTENNDIIANAFNGSGGKITISTTEIFGLEEGRSTPPNQTNDIDASSQFGLDGEIVINQLDLNPAQGLEELPTDIINVTNLVAQGCPAGNRGTDATKSQFILTGRGGIPPQPEETLRIPAILIEDDNLAIDHQQKPSLLVTNNQIVEANSWRINARGKVVLTSSKSPMIAYSYWHNLAKCHDF